jgi:nicotinate-nucleotide adenylyltransferase
MSSPLLVLGGMFDPVHRGHICAARFALDYLAANRLKMIPCHLPNHKSEPATQPEHRLAMLKLACEFDARIEIDPIELNRDQISYSVDTLSELKKQHSTLVFVLGVDSFNSLTEWHDWKRILELSHLLVLSRHGVLLSGETRSAVDFDQRRADSGEQLLSSQAGKIVYAEGFDFDIASSDIRKKIARDEDVSKELDAVVAQYINENNLYRQ